METAQPTGTVTLLFTDIEGSTRLLERLGPERYRESLDLHRRLLREAFERHGGYEVDHEGDAFFVAFARAADAVMAASEAQQVLTEADWPEGLPIRVRMGIHTGEPLAAPPKYVGLDVHKAARIMAAGHGGQVLLSRTTHDLLDAHLPLRELGEHRLKDLGQAERLWQLGEGTFPSLKSLHRTNLPVQPLPLVGRERELSEVTALLRDGARLVTLTGVGGTGKTRLAMHAAAEVAAAFPDGVWFVPLAPLVDPALVEATTSQVLQLEGPLAEALRSKRLLLLLDNFEHLLDAAPLVGEIAATAPEVCILVTSRERLALSAEHEYEVPALALADAVELFSLHARRFDAQFEASEAVVDVAQRLEGLPLALELAAARVKVLTVAQIGERLGESLDFLTGGARDAPERQRTLRATIKWSYELLSEREQLAFTQLAVFAGSFDLAAADAVAGADLDMVSSLVDKSLVRRTVDARFFVLETLRQFGADELERTGGRNASRHDHAAYYLGRARADAAVPWVPFPDEWGRRFLLDEAQFRATLTFLAEQSDSSELQELAELLWYTWFRYGRLAEGRSWLEKALAQPVGDRNREGVLLCGLSGIAWRQGDGDVAASAADAAVSIFRRLDNGRWLVHALRDVANCRALLGDLATAERVLIESEEHAIRVGDDLSVAAARGNRAEIMLTRGDYDEALALATAALHFSEASGGANTEHAAAIYHTCGLALFCLDRIDEAANAFCASLTAAGDPPSAEATLFTVDGLAAVAARRNEFERAARFLGATQRFSAETGIIMDALPKRLHDDAMAATRAALDRDRFAALRAIGEDAPLAELVREALAQGFSGDTRLRDPSLRTAADT